MYIMLFHPPLYLSIIHSSTFLLTSNLRSLQGFYALMATLDSEDDSSSTTTTKLTNSFQIKPNCHLGLKSRPSQSSYKHKLDKETSSECLEKGYSPCASAYSKTTRNCWQPEDSESHYNACFSFNNLGSRPIKRKRAAQVHKLSEKRRRHKINKRLRALRNLIPNCTKMDKASVLDEAIEYLKSLQLQLQIMPFFAGLCVPPTQMILPTQYPIIGAGAGQLFGLPFAGYGTRLHMPMNALSVESLRRYAQSLRWF